MFASYSAFWIALSFVMAVRSVMNHSLLGDPLTYSQAFFAAIATTLFWTVTLLPIAALSERFPMSGDSWLKNLSLHFLFASVFALAYVIWRTGLHFAFESMRRLDGSALHIFQVYLFGSLARSLLIYVGVVAIDHAWRYYRILQAERELSSKLQDQLAELQRDDDSPSSARSAYPERFILKERGRGFSVSVRDLDLIEGFGDYVSLHAGEKTHLLRETMRSMEQKLDSSRFVRVHRSAIVQINRVREVLTIGAGKYAVVLSTGTQVPLGQPGIERLEHLLGHSSGTALSEIRT
jgi:hypothetical protein